MLNGYLEESSCKTGDGAEDILGEIFAKSYTLVRVSEWERGRKNK